jgi:hypothetical protein
VESSRVVVRLRASLPRILGNGLNLRDSGKTGGAPFRERLGQA